MNGRSRAPSSVVIHGRVMPARRVDVLVSEDIRNEIYISGLTVEGSAVSAPQFVRSYFFCRRHTGGVFLDEIFHGADGHPLSLDRVEECVLVPGGRFDSGSDGEIFL